MISTGRKGEQAQARISRAAKFVTLIVALPSLSVAANASAQSKAGQVSDTFSVRGSNAFQISVDGSRSSVRLAVAQRFASGRVAEAEYTAPASSSGTEIQANLGILGSIAMKFHPSGTKRFTTYRPKGCRQHTVVRQVGTFEGTFRFVGEGGYTTAEVDKAEGSTGPPVNTFCGGFFGGHGNIHQQHRQHHHTSPTQFLFASTANRVTNFIAASNGRYHSAFGAELNETVGTFSIYRHVATVGPVSDFSATSRKHANVLPPAPFSGGATFERHGKGVRPSWSGSLSVSFPGKREVPLTGPDFTSVELDQIP